MSDRKEMLVKSLHVELLEKLETEHQNCVTFLFQDKTKRFSCDENLVIEALNDAGYSNDGYDYDDDDVKAIKNAIDRVVSNVKSSSLFKLIKINEIFTA